MSRMMYFSVAMIALVAASPLAAQSLTITTAGGDYGKAMKEVMWGPAAAELGLDVREETQSDGFAALKMQVTSGAVTTDVIHLGSPEGAQAAAQGLLEKLDYNIIDPKTLPAGAESEYCYPFSSYGTVMAWNTKTFGANAPKNWTEFWDVKAFPGKRALRANAQDLIEIALLSEGVAPGDIYKILDTPEGIKRAIARLEELKPDVAVWWTSGAQSAQILKDGEADLVVTWNGRAQSVKADGGPADYTFKGSVIGTDCLAVPKGSANREAAMKLISAMTQPARGAKLTDFIAYGPVNPAAYQGGLIPAEKMAFLATAPGNVETSVFSKADWWLKNGEAAQLAFDEMMNR
ncbi:MULTISPECIES: ABC transporter substrate-binding protein [Agrobacterium]|uniref:ABC transporter substrate-binding protein n=1 Tax=Agrobacterium tumefaciens TaxID=358 RepID=A0AAE6BIM6_AGRTU|nr:MULTISPECIES: ABC transporter substrate-binding protein [Agrobacterium]QCL77202.1 ABC transporter substrate-binding protein [Agrobacterium tumefaciens]QCL82710.1 ABC transporter substrate-binding protein [Agrobacterium tumefaciens]CUX70471.1 ABC transporter, binding protein [Agrobacterium sp. NCPPB 925]